MEKEMKGNNNNGSDGNGDGGLMVINGTLGTLFGLWQEKTKNRKKLIHSIYFRTHKSAPEENYQSTTCRNFRKVLVIVCILSLIEFKINQ